MNKKFIKILRTIIKVDSIVRLYNEQNKIMVDYDQVETTSVFIYDSEEESIKDFERISKELEI